MGVKASGSTIIRLLRKLIDEDIPKCSDTIGVDDFAYRKGQTYCTVICDGKSHRPIEILEGRDGKALKEWLSKNKHVKKVMRDRAGAYAKAITEELPGAMQIADRFHLHQNLLSAVKEALKREIPKNIPIQNDTPEANSKPNGEETPELNKKNEPDVLSETEKNRYEDIVKIQTLLADGYAPVQIKELLHTSYTRIRRYATGDPKKLCRFGGDKCSELEAYRDEVIALLVRNLTFKDALAKIAAMGYQGKITAFCAYCRKLIKELDIVHTPRKNKVGVTILPNQVPSAVHYVSKIDIFGYLWSGKEIKLSDIEYIVGKYPLISCLQECITEFRNVYAKKDPLLMDSFI